MTYHVLYNPLCGNGNGEKLTKQLDTILTNGTLIYHNIIEIENYSTFLSQLPPDDLLVISGGDGTLNHFINDTDGIEIQHTILYYATGTGNDFLHDLGKENGAAPFPINQYLKNLPTVTINGKSQRFLNGIGYGIDGYCCEVADQLKEKSDKPVNYTAIAIKGLLFHYHPTNAKITVDGKEYNYNKVWLAPTMNGRYYGGGMNITPDQDRLNNKTASVGIMYGSGKLKTLLVFPSIFKGEHVKHTEMMAIHTGKSITVEFDRPTALQIDGETVLGVSKYQVTCAEQ